MRQIGARRQGMTTVGGTDATAATEAAAGQPCRCRAVGRAGRCKPSRACEGAGQPRIRLAEQPVVRRPRALGGRGACQSKRGRRATAWPSSSRCEPKRRGPDVSEFQPDRGVGRQRRAARRETESDVSAKDAVAEAACDDADAKKRLARRRQPRSGVSRRRHRDRHRHTVTRVHPRASDRGSISRGRRAGEQWPALVAQGVPCSTERDDKPEALSASMQLRGIGGWPWPRSRTES